MKHLRIFGLLAVAGATVMSCIGTASADFATSPLGTTYTSTIKAASEGHVILDNPIAKIECSSSIEGKIESHGAGKPVAGKISSLQFANCTNEWHVTVVTGGSLLINQTLASNGEAFSSGATIEATRFGVSCRYATNSTTLGDVTSGTPATMEFGLGAFIPFHSGSFLCGSGSTSWTGSYKIVSPSSLFFDNS